MGPQNSPQEAGNGHNLIKNNENVVINKPLRTSHLLEVGIETKTNDDNEH